MMRKLLTNIARDEQGATLVEFALVAPTLLLMLMGLFELGHGIYVQSVVTGVMQDAGRDSTLETAKTSDMKKLLKDRVLQVSPNSKVTLTWKNYGSYTEIGDLEDYTDVNGDGKCSKDEPFEDLNENGIHDYYSGKGGIGNARDAVVFKASVEYDRLFPMPSLAGWEKKATVEGVTVLRNQPYRQNERKPKVGKCTGGESYGRGGCADGVGLGCGNTTGGTPTAAAASADPSDPTLCERFPNLCAVGRALMGSV